MLLNRGAVHSCEFFDLALDCLQDFKQLALVVVFLNFDLLLFDFDLVRDLLQVDLLQLFHVFELAQLGGLCVEF